MDGDEREAKPRHSCSVHLYYAHNAHFRKYHCRKCHDFSGELPLNMIQTQSTESTDGPATASDTPLSKTFPMVTLAQW